MELSEITLKLLAAKSTKGLTFTDLGKVIGRDEVWVAALCYRQATASPEEAKKLVAALGLEPAVVQTLTEFPTNSVDHAVLHAAVRPWPRPSIPQPKSAHTVRTKWCRPL